MDEISRQAVRILRLFGDTTTKRVVVQVGPEQEYFLVDKAQYAQREDLRMCGRTCSAQSPQGTGAGRPLLWRHPAPGRRLYEGSG